MKAEYYVELPSGAGGELKAARWADGALRPLDSPAFPSGRAGRVVAFAPGTAVSRHSVQVSSRNEVEATRAALFALEDDLAQRVEDVALALSPQTAANGPRDAYVVDKALLENWRALLQDAGFCRARIIPEISLTTQSSAWRFPDRVLLIRDGYAAAVDARVGDLALREFMDASGFHGEDALPADSLEVLAGLYETQGGVSLDRPDEGGRKGAKAWALAGGLAAAVLALWVGILAFETRGLQAKANAAETRAQRLFHTQFPNAPASVDVHAETRRLMQFSSAGASAPFRSAAASLYQAISASPTIQLRALRYSAEASALVAELKFANAPDEAAFRSRLDSYGLKVISADIADPGTGPEGSFVLERRP